MGLRPRAQLWSKPVVTVYVFKIEKIMEGKGFIGLFIGLPMCLTFIRAHTFSNSEVQLESGCGAPKVSSGHDHPWLNRTLAAI